MTRTVSNWSCDNIAVAVQQSPSATHRNTTNKLAADCCRSVIVHDQSGPSCFRSFVCLSLAREKKRQRLAKLRHCLGSRRASSA